MMDHGSAVRSRSLKLDEPGVEAGVTSERADDVQAKPSPLLLIDDLLEYADKCARECQRAELAASQIARAWANHNSYGYAPGPRARYNWNLGLRLWIQMVPVNEIARQLGCARQAVHLAASRYGWPKQRDVRLDFKRAPKLMIGDETVR